MFWVALCAILKVPEHLSFPIPLNWVDASRWIQRGLDLNWKPKHGLFDDLLVGIVGRYSHMRGTHFSSHQMSSSSLLQQTEAELFSDFSSIFEFWPACKPFYCTLGALMTSSGKFSSKLLSRMEPFADWFGDNNFCHTGQSFWSARMWPIRKAFSIPWLFLPVCYGP